MSDPDFNYLVVSDLHLSAGVDPRTNQLSVNEDFLSDAAFAEFLRFHNLSAKRRSAEGDSAPWKLIINGDLFCFLSVTSYPARDANALCTSVNKLLAQPAQPFFPLAEPTLRRQQAQDWLQQAAAACNEAESKSHLRIGKLAAQLLEAGNTLPVDKLWEYMRLAIETLILAQKKGKAALPRKHRTYGLGTSWPETVWKLDRIAESHPIFFQALAWFMDQGHSVVVIKGNHDVEFFWPEVQQRMQDLLCDAHAQLSLSNSQWWTNEPLIPILNTATQFKKSLEEQFKIEPWVHYVPGLMFVEHGNQYEILNGIDNFLAPTILDAPHLIELPPGAFFGRYFQNKLEQIVPFIDNLRPISRALGWGFKNRFFRYLWALIRHGLNLILVAITTIWRSYIKQWFYRLLRRYWRGGIFRKRPKPNYPDNEKYQITAFAMQSSAIQPLTLKHLAQIENEAHDLRNRPLVKLGVYARLLAPIFAVLVTFLGGVMLSVLAWITDFLESVYHVVVSLVGSVVTIALLKNMFNSVLYSDGIDDYLDKSALRLWSKVFKPQFCQSGQLPVRYIIHGHTHAPNIMSLRDDGQPPWYVNTGSWLYQVGDIETWKRMPQDFTFLQVLPEQDTGWPRLLRWNDASGRPEPLYVYE